VYTKIEHAPPSAHPVLVRALEQPEAILVELRHLSRENAILVVALCSL
jgi:hypothetical protein